MEGSEEEEEEVKAGNMASVHSLHDPLVFLQTSPAELRETCISWKFVDLTIYCFFLYIIAVHLLNGIFYTGQEFIHQAVQYCDTSAGCDD